MADNGHDHVDDHETRSYTLLYYGVVWEPDLVELRTALAMGQPAPSLYPLTLEIPPPQEVPPPSPPIPPLRQALAPPSPQPQPQPTPPHQSSLSSPPSPHPPPPASTPNLSADGLNMSVKRKQATKDVGHPSWLPPNWDFKFKERKNGRSAGQIDKCYVSPEGHRFRSKVEVEAHLARQPLDRASKRGRGKPKEER